MARQNEKALIGLTPKMCNTMVWIFQKSKVKKCMVQSTISIITKVIELTRSVLMEDKFYRPSFTNVVFQWSMEHFAERMNPSIDYIDVLRLENPQSVFITKFLTDLENLEKYLNMIAENDIKKTIADLEGCLTLLEIRDNLFRDFRINKAIVTALQYEDTYFARSEEKSLKEADHLLNTTIDNYIDQYLVSDAISQRHYRNTVLTSLDISEYKLKLKTKDTENSIQDCLKEIAKINFCNEQSVDHHKLQIEEFRSKISYWSYRYDVEYEIAENEESNYTMSIAALKKQKQDYEETIIFYHQEIQRIVEEEEREKQRKAAELEKAKLGKQKRKSKIATPKKKKI